MVKRFDFHQDYKYAVRTVNEHGKYVQYVDYEKLEAENARLRQQRDAANAQLDFILESQGRHRITISGDISTPPEDPNILKC